MEDRGGGGGSFVAVRKIYHGLDRTNNTYHTSNSDAEMEDSANDMEIRSQDDDTPAYNSTYNGTVSSPTRFSYYENSSKTLTHEPSIQKEDQEKDDYDVVLNSAKDDISAYNGAYNITYSSPTRLSVTENTRKKPGFEPDIQKGNYDAISRYEVR